MTSKSVVSFEGSKHDVLKLISKFCRIKQAQKADVMSTLFHPVALIPRINYNWVKLDGILVIYSLKKGALRQL